MVRFIKQVKVTQSYPTLCDPEIIQARILEWVAFPFTGDLPNPGIKPRSLALWADSLPASHKGSPRILEWVAYPSPVDLPDPRIDPGSLALQADSLLDELPGKPKRSLHNGKNFNIPGCYLSFKHVCT